MSDAIKEAVNTEDVFKAFGEMIVKGHQIVAQNKARKEWQERVELNSLRYKTIDDATLKAMWDNDDYASDCDEIHMELNRRGLGEYCAV